MTGTIINFLTIIAGGLLGLLLGNRFSERIRLTIMNALGLFVLLYAVRLFTETKNSMVVLISLVIGTLIGEWAKIEDGLGALAVWMEKTFNKTSDGDKNQFIKGFLTTSLLYCIGPLAILGSIQDGLNGDYYTLAIKAVIDGISAIAFASSLGVGVLFSSLIVLIYQGGLTLLASQLQFLTSDVMLSEINALGGIMLAGLAVGSLLEIKKIRVANFLPAFIIVPFIVLLFKYFGLY
jgi:uncharacterized membrane protein YqgA involved in biofilm formation